MRCAGCAGARAAYGPASTGRQLRCRTCRLPEDVYLTFRCHDCGAYKRMMYTEQEGAPPRRCVRCKRPDDVLVYRRYCQSPLHPSGREYRVVVTSKTDYLCYVCRHFGRWRNRKERAVARFLQHALPDRVPALLDRAIGGNLSLRYRPDVYYDLVDRALVVEVDEDEHATYPVHCEAKRMAEMAMSLHKPTVFLRYNPDRLEETDGRATRVTARRRLAALAHRVRHWIAVPRHAWEPLLHVEYLWYSERRTAECRAALNACLRDVWRCHPELKQHV